MWTTFAGTRIRNWMMTPCHNVEESNRTKKLPLFLFFIMFFTSSQLLTIIALSQATLASASTTTTTTTTTSELPPKLIVFSFDGFRPDYVNKTDTPNLYAMAKSGVRGHMVSQFVTKTYPNHQSIVTGLYEQYHGVINNQFIDPLRHNISFNPDEKLSFWWDQFNISVPIYIANQVYESGRFSGSMQWPGSIVDYSSGPAFALARGTDQSKRERVFYLHDYDKSQDWRLRIDTVMQWLTDDKQPANCLFVYFAEPDSTAHNYGPFANKTLAQVKLLDSIVGYFQKRLADNGLLHRANLIFLSDHGMSEVTADRLILLKQCEKDYPDLRYQMEGVSPVFNLVPLQSPKQFLHLPLAQAVQAALNQCSEKRFASHYHVFLQNEIPSIYHYGHNRRILPLFLLADNGYDVGFADNGWKPGGYPVWGNHGYNNSLPEMEPLFIAHGRSFKRDFDHPIRFQNIDLYPLMLRLLQIPFALFPSNGSFERVHQMLTNQLFLTDNDYVLSRLDHSKEANKSVNDNKWIQLFIYFGIGFCAILFAGTCFVLTTGFGKSSSSPDRNYVGFGRRTMDQSKKSNLLVRTIRRIVTKTRGSKSYYDSDYRLFSNSRPNTLDSSFDDDEDEEDELYSQTTPTTNHGNGRRKKANSNRDNNNIGSRNGSNSRLTDIDWDIIGTGLDIDLSSQLRPGLMSEPKDYIPPRNTNDSDDDNEYEDNRRPIILNHNDNRNRQQQFNNNNNNNSHNNSNCDNTIERQSIVMEIGDSYNNPNDQKKLFSSLLIDDDSSSDSMETIDIGTSAATTTTTTTTAEINSDTRRRSSTNDVDDDNPDGNFQSKSLFKSAKQQSTLIDI